MKLSHFDRFWLAEHQRQRDVAQVHPTDLNQPLNSELSLEQQVLQRAERCAIQCNELTYVQRWHQSRRLLTLVVGVLASLLGIGTTQALLSQAQPISLLFAVGVLVLPNLIMLLLWALFALRRSKPRGITAFGLQLMHWLQRQPEQAALAASWVEHCQRQRLLTPLMALVTHSFWLVIATFSAATLLLYLSFNDYAFRWATTILEQPQLMQWAQLIGWLPELLFGVGVPEQGSTTSTADFSAIAGRWLTLCVLTYALLPRLLCLLGAMLVWAYRLTQLRLDLSEPGYYRVSQALQAQQRGAQVVDADAGDAAELLVFHYARSGDGEVIASLDYEADTSWSAPVSYWGVVASYTQKQALLKQLQAQPVAHLTIRVASSLTPDRSSMRYLASLTPYTQELKVVLVDAAGDTYRAQWQQLLQRYEVNYD